MEASLVLCFTKYRPHTAQWQVYQCYIDVLPQCNNVINQGHLVRKPCGRLTHDNILPNSHLPQKQWIEVRSGFGIRFLVQELIPVVSATCYPEPSMFLVSEASVIGSYCVVLLPEIVETIAYTLSVNFPKPKEISKLICTFQSIYENARFQRNVKRGVLTKQVLDKMTAAYMSNEKLPNDISADDTGSARIRYMSSVPQLGNVFTYTLQLTSLGGSTLLSISGIIQIFSLSNGGRFRFIIYKGYGWTSETYVDISMHSTGITKIPAIYEIPYKITKLYFETNKYKCIWVLALTLNIHVHPNVTCGINETLWQRVGKRMRSSIVLPQLISPMANYWKHLFFKTLPNRYIHVQMETTYQHIAYNVVCKLWGFTFISKHRNCNRRSHQGDLCSSNMELVTSDNYLVIDYFVKLNFNRIIYHFSLTDTTCEGVMFCEKITAVEHTVEFVGYSRGNASLELIQDICAVIIVQTNKCIWYQIPPLVHRLSNLMSCATKFMMPTDNTAKQYEVISNIPTNSCIQEVLIYEDVLSDQFKVPEGSFRRKFILIGQHLFVMWRGSCINLHFRIRFIVIDTQHINVDNITGLDIYGAEMKAISLSGKMMHLWIKFSDSISMQVIKRQMWLHGFKYSDFLTMHTFLEEFPHYSLEASVTCQSTVVIEIVFGKIDLTWSTASDNSKLAPIKLTFLPVYENIVVTLAGQLTTFQCTMRIDYQEMFTNVQTRYSKSYVHLFHKHTKCPIDFTAISGTCLHLTMHKNASWKYYDQQCRKLNSRIYSPSTNEKIKLFKHFLTAYQQTQLIDLSYRVIHVGISRKNEASKNSQYLVIRMAIYHINQI